MADLSGERATPGGGALDAALAGLVAAAVLFFGGVHVWFQHALFLAALAVLALSVAGAVRSGTCALPFGPAALAAVAFVAFGLLQAELGWALDAEATRRALGRPAAAAIVFCVAAARARDRSARRRLAGALVALAAFEVVYGIVEHQTGHEQIGLWPRTHYSSSVTGTFVNRNHFAGFLACVTPIAVGLGLGEGSSGSAPGLRLWTRLSLALERGETWRRAAWLAVAALCVLGACLALSRGGLIALGAGLGSFFLGMAREPRARRGAALAVALLATLAIAGVFLYGPDELFARLSDLPREARGHENSRLAWARSTVALITDHPWRGVGFGNFELAFRRYQNGWIGGLTIDHAHDDILEVVAEVGVPLAALGLASVLHLIASGLRAAPASPEAPLEIGLASALVACTTHAAFDFDLELAGPLLTAALVAGMVAGGRFVRGFRIGRRPASLAGALLVAAAAASAPGAIDRLRAERLVHPTVREDDDARDAAARLGALERAVALVPADAAFRLEAATCRLEAFDAELDRSARAAERLALGPDRSLDDASRTRLREALRLARASEAAAVRARALADLRAARLASPEDSFVLARLALVSPDRAEVFRVSAAAAEAFPDGAATLCESALGRLRFDPADALARRWLARGLTLAPELRPSVAASARSLGIDLPGV